MGVIGRDIGTVDMAMFGAPIWMKFAALKPHTDRQEDQMGKSETMDADRDEFREHGCKHVHQLQKKDRRQK